MPAPEIDLLTIEKGLVTAPAGCGKTHLIASALTRHEGSKPILVLTHTNSGVAALRGRLERAGVPTRSYRLYTIDGWAMRLTRAFPERASLADGISDLRNPGSDYPTIRRAAATLLERGCIDDILAASYRRAIVDEYQDCGVLQHAMVSQVARILPLCALGDPMQAIFNFGTDRLISWTDVCNQFPLAGELTTPWRWKNVGADELGEWLLDARARLIRRASIDLGTAPRAVTWVELSGTNDHARRLAAAKANAPTRDGRVLIIADSRYPDAHRQFASQTPGAVTVEAVDLKDLVAFAAGYKPEAPDGLARLLAFAQSVMTNVGAQHLLNRVASLMRGSARNPPSDVETRAIAFVQNPTFSNAVDLLVDLNAEAGVRAHRPAVLRACIQAMQICRGSASPSFHEATIAVREEHRLTGRPLAKRSVGSTLLLKGLEAELTVVLNADVLDAPNLYVAMTRGSMALTVCSRLSVLSPKK